MNQTFSGLASAVGSYVLWGILPIYWRMLLDVPAYTILAHRIVWSFIFMMLVVVCVNRGGQFIAECREIFSDTKRWLALASGSVLISLNWLTYIWAVNHDRIIETSLGYYINPLVSIFLAIVVLKERLSFWQMISALLALAGVMFMAVHIGTVPWVALALALSFGLYGLCKKLAKVTAVAGLTLETCLVTPPALFYLFYFHQGGATTGLTGFSTTAVLLAGTGIITAIPLLLFANSANRLSLTVLSFVQYLSPTIALLIGVFLYHEQFTAVHAVTFAFIWSALLLLSLGKTAWFKKVEAYAVSLKKAMES